MLDKIKRERVQRGLETGVDNLRSSEVISRHEAAELRARFRERKKRDKENERGKA